MVDQEPEPDDAEEEEEEDYEEEVDGKANEGGFVIVLNALLVHPFNSSFFFKTTNKTMTMVSDGSTHVGCIWHHQFLFSQFIYFLLTTEEDDDGKSRHNICFR